MDQNAYREMMLKKMKQQQADKGKTGLGKKTVLDFSKAIGKTVSEWQPKYKDQGENAFDILPFVITQEWYTKLRMPTGRPNGLQPGMLDHALTIPVHRSVGVNNDIYLCPREAFGDGCPICDEMFEAYKAGDKDKASKLRSGWRSFYNIYDYNDTSKGIQLFEIAYTLFESTTKNDLQRCNLIDESMLNPSGPVIFADLQEGKTIIAKFKKMTYKGKYDYPEIESIKFEDRDPYDETILQKVFPLDMMVVRATYDEIKNAYYAINDHEEEEKNKVEERLPETKIEEKKEVVQQTVTQQEEPKPTVGEVVRTGRVRNFDTQPEITCPAGKVFGKDYNTGPACEGKTEDACTEDVFNKCAECFNKLKNQVVDPKKEDPPVQEKIEEKKEVVQQTVTQQEEPRRRRR